MGGNITPTPSPPPAVGIGLNLIVANLDIAIGTTTTINLFTVSPNLSEWRFHDYHYNRCQCEIRFRDKIVSKEFKNISKYNEDKTFHCLLSCCAHIK